MKSKKKPGKLFVVVASSRTQEPWLFAAFKNKTTALSCADLLDDKYNCYDDPAYNRFHQVEEVKVFA